MHLAAQDARYLPPAVAAELHAGREPLLKRLAQHTDELPLATQFWAYCRDHLDVPTSGSRHRHAPRSRIVAVGHPNRC